ncbi:hypothetical protein DFH09DRAFT_1035731 [Mycena vulgaris]|nr:hypothetical protein DFH09DRAFT_1035731 [Mycena vulgaris]
MANSAILRKVVADTNADIAHYRSLLDNLLTKRDDAQHQLDSIVYPVLMLPPEITSEIFLQCLPTSQNDLGRPTVNPREPPMLLTHVCSKWKEIAISTPALWATMVFNGRLGADVLETWLDRARALPLSLKLRIDRDLEDDITSAISDTLIEHSGRIRSLEVEICVHQLGEIENAYGGWSFPLLQKLTIWVLDADDYDLWGGPSYQIFKNAPLLRQASFNDAPPSSIALPWRQLTKFSGTCYMIPDCLEVLRLIPNLTECAFTFPHYDIGADHTKLTHSNLQSLSLFEIQSDQHVSEFRINILEVLTLPALHTLQIFDCESYAFNDEILIAFLSRSLPPLRKFTIRLDGLDQAIFEAASLTKMPELVDLEIWKPSTSFIVDFFDFFNDCDPAFLPKLQRLTLLGYHPAEGIHKMKLLQRGLAARWQARHREGFVALESFCLVWERNVVGSLKDLEDALLPFRELVADGMDIRIQISGGKILYI